MFFKFKWKENTNLQLQIRFKTVEHIFIARVEPKKF